MAVIFLKPKQKVPEYYKKSPVEIWTGQVGKKYTGIITMDVSVKSGNKIFAPTWDMVMGYKDGTLSIPDYEKQYNKIMKDSKKKHPDAWVEIMKRKEIVFLCYCKPGDFCHRVLLAHEFETLGAICNGEFY